MPLRRYYKILGLQPNASDSDVRKAYRKLVMKYHPDRNKNSYAKEQFLKIKEAYEIITNKDHVSTTRKVNRRSHFTYNSSQFQTTKSKIQQEKERIELAQKRYREQKIKEHIENELYFRRLTTGAKWKTIRILSILCGVIIFSMILDRFLPHHYEKDVVTHYRLNVASSIGGEPASLIRTKKGNHYWVGDIDYQLYSEAPNVYIETSWILHDPINIISRGKTQLKSYKLYYTFYKNYIMIICVFLAPMITMIFKRKTPLFTFLYLFSYYITGGLVIYLLLTNDRWAHLLTLGFL